MVIMITLSGMDITVRLVKDLLFAYYIRNVPKPFVSVYHPKICFYSEMHNSNPLLSVV